MIKSNCTTAKQSFKHLTDIQRGRLEEMANELNVSQSTISRELKRGRTRQMASDRTYYDRYLADAGVRVYNENRQYSRARDNPNEHVPCTKTVYTLIDNGVLPIKNIDLPIEEYLNFYTNNSFRIN